MGSTYANITLYGPKQEPVVRYIAQQGWTAFVLPTVDKFTVVCEREGDSMSEEALRALASGLSHQFQCPALALYVYDSDNLWYRLYQRGTLIDEYDSDPGYWDYWKPEEESKLLHYSGNASLLCAAFDTPETVWKVNQILQAEKGDDGYIFADERHRDLAQALGLPSFVAYLGFRGLDAGYMPDGIDRSALMQTF